MRLTVAFEGLKKVCVAREEATGSDGKTVVTLGAMVLVSIEYRNANTTPPGFMQLQLKRVKHDVETAVLL